MLSSCFRDHGSDGLNSERRASIAISRTSKAKRTDVRFVAHCKSCHLQTKCTPRVAGRIIEINTAEELRLAARKDRWIPEFRDRYRERARSERKIAQLKFATQKVPWRGLVKADAWVKIRVAALNLDRIGRIPGHFVPVRNIAVVDIRQSQANFIEG